MWYYLIIITDAVMCKHLTSVAGQGVANFNYLIYYQWWTATEYIYSSTILRDLYFSISILWYFLLHYSLEGNTVLFTALQLFDNFSY